MRQRAWLLITGLAVLAAASTIVAGSKAAGIPSSLTDTEFRTLSTNLSEPEGNTFRLDNFTSNETRYPDVFADLKQNTGGVYLGVGPEQNFNYIAAVHPEIAFIIDIRRGNLLEQLLYKALFELSADRAGFVERLFSRRIAQPATSTDAAALFRALDAGSPDNSLFKSTLAAVDDRLTRIHQFPLTGADLAELEHVLRAFLENGPRVTYLGPPQTAPLVFFPTYQELMTETDRSGRNWSYLETEDRFRFIKQFEERNLIVPVVGDFAGPAAMRAVGKYIRGHGSRVSVIYASNVEQLLFDLGDAWRRYYANLSAIPFDAHGIFIRSAGLTNAGVGSGGPGLRAIMLTEPVADLLKAIKSGSIAVFSDILRQSHCTAPELVKFGCRP